jgi:hypothetical protein
MAGNLENKVYSPDKGFQVSTADESKWAGVDLKKIDINVIWNGIHYQAAEANITIEASTHPGTTIKRRVC